MPQAAVTSASQVVQNIERYQKAVREHPAIRARVGRVWSWYAFKDAIGSWRFAPSKFVGYRDANAESYLAGSGFEGDLDGRMTERVLTQWFVVPEKGSKLERELTESLRAFLAEFGKAPGARARINVLAANTDAALPVARGADSLLSRITADPAVCGGRPCIKGTRMRVADIVEAMAQGATKEELLKDFDYLDERDIAAALLYAARSADHRVVRTA